MDNDGFSVKEDLTESVNINLDPFNNYAEYFKSLSKSVRQNLRTAKNRIQKDGAQFSLQVFNGKEVTRKDFNSMINVFLNRHECRYGTPSTVLLKWYYRHFDYYFNSIKKDESTKIAFLRIDNRIAAFFIGFYDKNCKSVFIPRLAISDIFSRYSPGYLLVSEYIKICFDCNIRNVDLLSGTEKYKFDLGGKMYNRYRISLKVIESI